MANPPLAIVDQMLQLFAKSGASELEFSDGNFSFRVATGAASAVNLPVAPPPVRPVAAPVAPVVALPEVAAPVSASDVVSPMHGLFHRAPAPGEPPFVNMGDTVKADSQVGIIEAMKVFIPVLAGMNGTVGAILVENGAEVESGQTLMRISGAGA